MYIRKNSIVIRSAKASDAIILEEWWNDGEIMAHAGFPLGLKTTVEKIELDIRKNSSGHSERLIIEYDVVPIGEMSYRSLGNDTVEIGIKICDHTYQNRGIGTVILEMYLKFLFTELDFALIVLDTNLNNKRAQHIYEKLGFKRKSIAYDNWKDQNGELQSTVYYEMNYRDYHNRNKQIGELND